MDSDTPAIGSDLIALLPVAKFHGVGPVTAAKMQRLGIQTRADLHTKLLGFLQQQFGKSAAWYLAIANGEDDRPVVANRRRKSSGSEATFALRAVRNPSVLRMWAISLSMFC